MRILMLVTYPEIQGSLPKFLPPLAKTLRKQGHAVVEYGWGRHHDEESFGEKIAGRFLDILRIVGLLRKERPDIFFVNSSLAPSALLRDNCLLLASLGLNPTTVIHFHGGQLVPEGESGHRIFRVATRLLFKLCDGVIVCSQEECRVLSDFAPQQQVFVADTVFQPEPCVPSCHVPRDWNLPGNRPIVFFAGRLIPEKGVLDLLDAIPLILPEAPCHFLLAGTGPLEPEVRKRLGQSPWKEHLTFPGYLEGGDLELAYRSAALFVLPTYHPEGFPVVVQEAMGHGLPIVTTHIRGMADHLIDGVHARFIPPRNPAALAQGLLELLKDPILRRRMATANLEKIRDFRPEAVVRKYLRIFQEVFGRQTGIKLETELV
jgi:glycosyltransferase involved in cell wall biosynthesis